MMEDALCKKHFVCSNLYYFLRDTLPVTISLVGFLMICKTVLIVLNDAN
jgi:hypothetical protein